VATPSRGNSKAIFQVFWQPGIGFRRTPVEIEAYRKTAGGVWSAGLMPKSSSDRSAAKDNGVG